MIGILLEKVTREVILVGICSFAGTFGAIAAERLWGASRREEVEESEKGVTVVNNINVGTPGSDQPIFIEQGDE